MGASSLIGAGLGALGTGIGAYGATGNLTEGAQKFRENALKGIDTLNQGKASTNTAFQPYTTAGQTGIAGQTSTIQGRQQAKTADYNPVTAAGAQEYLDPSAKYQIDQANRATQASALAKGGMGGGLAKALSDNSAKMAQTYWTQAQANQLAAKNQNFNQQDINYQRNNQYQQDQINNYGDLAKQGLTATGNNQTLQGQYNTGISDAYGAIGNSAQSAENAKAGLFASASNAIGNNLAKGIFG